MKVIIAGPRYKDPKTKEVFDDFEFVSKAVEASGFEITEVVSGKALGVDSLGEVWAAANCIDVTEMPADWDRHGKSAGFIRNSQMADYCDAAVIIWDGRSRGTGNMILEMNKRHKPYHLAMIPSGLEMFCEE